MVPQPHTPDNILKRLKSRLDQARADGFKIRMEFLDGEQASWCVIGGIPTIFVDQSQTAAEQLRQLDEILESCAGESMNGPSENSAASQRAA